MIKELNAVMIDKFTDVDVRGRDVIHELYEFKMKANDNTEIVCRFLRVEDYTKHEMYCLGVPVSDDTKTALGAKAWTFGLKAEEFRPIVET